MTRKKVRFLLVGAGDMAEKGMLPPFYHSPYAEVVGILSRDQSKAQGIIDRWAEIVPEEASIRALGGGYDTLPNGLEFDAVYTSIPLDLRPDFNVMAAEAGKHVLTEKPGATSVSELKRTTDACLGNNVQFRTNEFFPFSRRFTELLEPALEEIGRFQTATLHFSFFDDTQMKGNVRLEELGSVGDLDTYNARMLLKVAKGDRPVKLISFVETTLQADGHDPVPGAIRTVLIFEDGRTATFYSSFNTAFAEDMHVYGTEADLFARDFVLPNRGSEVSLFVQKRGFTNVTGDRVPEPGDSGLRSLAEEAAGRPTSQDTRAVSAFCRPILQGKLNTTWPSEALDVQAILDAQMESFRTPEKMITIKWP